VAIRAEFVERRDAEDVVRFTVEDTGIGVSREEMERLFRPFSQANGETSQIYGGSGLGLSICQKLATLMGGSIEMQSEVGVGTTMSFVLPLPIAEVPVDPPGITPSSHAPAFVGRRAVPTADQAHREGTLVLLVDDHPINRMVLLKQVNALGYAAEVAENGLEALDKWSSGAFGAVITDCNMPEMSGYELARHIRACEARIGHPRTPLIACTANALGGEADNCFAAGMDDYLSKPVDLALLSRALEHWLPLPGFMAPNEEIDRPQAVTPRVSVTQVVDAATLAEITGGSPRLEREILARFRQYNSEDANLLMNAVEKGEIQEVLRASHRIKGAARTIGAMPLATVCERLERASRTNDWNAVKDSMMAFRDELDRLEAHIEALARAQSTSASAG
jgi:CheY-like chemotaxis protein/HPt (histidine-containing phosphotransfer) domain-containing protein